MSTTATAIVIGGAQGLTDGNAHGLNNKALGIIEGARAVWSLVGQDYVGKFVVFGGAALLLHGARLQTRDVDVGITGDSLDAFERAARVDPRFREYPSGWEYATSYGFNVHIDFVQISGGHLHQVEGYCLDKSLPVATLVDIALSKGITYVDRGEDRDMDGLLYAVEKMLIKGQNFKALNEEQREVLQIILDRLDCSSERGLHTVITTLL